MGILERTLTIKRVPNVLTNYQEDQPEANASSNALIGYGRNCLGKCCLPGSKLPLYVHKRDGEGSDDEGAYTDEITPPMTFLVQLLLGRWEDRAMKGLFRYGFTQCETKVIPGRFGFITQINEGHHLKKHATEFRIDQFLQSFDCNKFNFTKVGQEEALLRFESGNDQMSHYYPSSSVSESDSPDIIAINCYAEKQALGEVSQEILETQVNPAVWEISGHIVLKRREDYEKATEEYAWRLLTEVSLSRKIGFRG